MQYSRFILKNQFITNFFQLISVDYVYHNSVSLALTTELYYIDNKRILKKMALNIIRNFAPQFVSN